MPFSRSQRLRSNEQFKQLWQSGRRISFLGGRVLYQLNEQATPRLGISVAKKQIRLAVNRNRFKRIVRETFRSQQDQLATVDMVVVVYKEFAVLSSTEQRHQLISVWEKLAARVNK